MFQTLLSAIQTEIVNSFFKVSITQNPKEGEVTEAEEKAISGKADFKGADEEELSGSVVSPKKDSDKIGRNDPCPCGSGKKYKKCCGK
jgi:preprotein translocase subunit SecA